MKTRTSTWLLATLIFALLSPTTFANAEDVPQTISIFEIGGVTPPVAGAIPVETITETDQFTGTVVWENQYGAFEGVFQPQTLYKAIITLTPASGYTITDVAQDSFSVEGATNVYNDGSSNQIRAYFSPALEDATESLDISFAGDGSIDIREIFGDSPLLENGDLAGPLSVDRIAVDSQNRIVVLASFLVDGQNIDHHILFRLNEDGSYDDTFNESGPTLRISMGDTPKPYVLVTTTCVGYTERLDLEIDSEDQILVMLSGSAEESACDGTYVNFVARYLTDGTIDPDFGEFEDGIIGSLSPQSGPAEFLMADITLDNQGRILIGYLSTNYLPQISVSRHLQNGITDPDFGNVFQSETRMGFSILDLAFPDDVAGAPFQNLVVMADNLGGYMVGFTASITGDFGTSGFTQLQRLDEFGDLDESFHAPVEFESPDGTYVIPYFFMTDIVPDGPSGFLMSGTFSAPVGDSQIFGIMLRIKFDGTYDTNFVNPATEFLLNSTTFNYCFNASVLKNRLSYETNDGVIAGNYCGAGDANAGRLKAFSSFGDLEGHFSIRPTIELGFEGQFVNQLILISNRRIVSLSGSRPTTGALGFLDSVGEFNYGSDPVDWTHATITRYEYLGSTPQGSPLTITPSTSTVNAQVGVAITPLDFTISGGASDDYARLSWSPELPAGLEFSDGQITGTPTVAGTTNVSITVTDSPEETSTATTTILFVISPESSSSSPIVYEAPKPVPYLKTLTTPKLNLIEGRLVCSAGTYNAGYTLDGVIQGSATAPFTPASYTYNLLINGVTENSFGVISSNSTNVWNLPAVVSGALFTCSVTVNLNALSNSDKSSDNHLGNSAALSTQATTIATANADYSASLSANIKAYEKTLTDNRTAWRSSIEKNRTTYLSELIRINALTTSKETRALKSSALRIYITSQKQIAADYSASKPTALTTKETADKAALDTKNAAIAMAYAAYATFIESIGYGVLIP